MSLVSCKTCSTFAEPLFEEGRSRPIDDFIRRSCGALFGFGHVSALVPEKSGSLLSFFPFVVATTKREAVTRAASECVLALPVKTFRRGSIA